MLTKHPLENPSLAPFGLVTKFRWNRLTYVPTHTSYWVNEEVVIAKLWEERNSADAPRPLPVQDIIHRILPRTDSKYVIASGDFNFRDMPYLTRDIVVLSSTIQWFGTNVGRTYLDPQFSHEKLVRRMKDTPAFFTHVCTSECRTGSIGLYFCRFKAEDATERDGAVIDSLFRWLETVQGRAFIMKFQVKKKHLCEEVSAIKRTGVEGRNKVA